MVILPGYLENNQIKFCAGVELPHEREAIANIDIEHGKFVIKPISEGHKLAEAWIVIRNISSETNEKSSCQLKVGDDIKLGIHEFKVLEINTGDDKEHLMKLYVMFNTILGNL